MYWHGVFSHPYTEGFAKDQKLDYHGYYSQAEVQTSRAMDGLGLLQARESAANRVFTQITVSCQGSTTTAAETYDKELTR